MSAEDGVPSAGSEASSFVPNQLSALVPSFDPSKDDLQVYVQKVGLARGSLASWQIYRIGNTTDFELQWLRLSETPVAPEGAVGERSKICETSRGDPWRSLGPIGS